MASKFSGHNSRGLHLASAGGGSAVRKQFSKTGIRTGFSGKSFASVSSGETAGLRYSRFRSLCGRYGDLSNFPIAHPDLGTPAYHNFYKLKFWLESREQRLREAAFCSCCGGVAGDRVNDIELHLELDHVWPRALFPQWEDRVDNLAILCQMCNRAKGNLYADDWRIGPIPLNARGTFWHIRPDNYALRMQLANNLRPFIG